MSIMCKCGNIETIHFCFFDRVFTSFFIKFSKFLDMQFENVRYKVRTACLDKGVGFHLFGSKKRMPLWHKFTGCHVVLVCIDQTAQGVPYGHAVCYVVQDGEAWFFDAEGSPPSDYNLPQAKCFVGRSLQGPNYTCSVFVLMISLAFIHTQSIHKLKLFLSKRGFTTWHRVVSVFIKDYNIKIALPAKIKLDTARNHVSGPLIDQMRRLIGPPIKRGRRPTGKAKTSAERVAAYRARQAGNA